MSDDGSRLHPSIPGMRIWAFPDRHPNGDGPWRDEPDKAQWVDPGSGLDCLIVRGGLGSLCGYVGVPPEQPWHGRSPGEVRLIAHGNVNFAAPCDEGEGHDRVCHVADPGRPERLWWFGFDCARGGDLIPIMDRMMPGLNEALDCEYRDFDYVQFVVRILAAQLAEVG